MLERVELQHKVKCFGEEYDVIIHDKTNFKTAFDTLNYAFGKYNKSEKAIVGFSDEGYKSIFNSNGNRKIYFYEEENEVETIKNSFINNILENITCSYVHIILCVPAGTSIYNTSEMLHNILNKNKVLEENSLFYVISNYKIEKPITRIIIGT